ncbi:MAG: pyridoxal phosphate-dependent aminotransferase [Prevotellaceae bacterium]|jgi:cystathionine beta-lyase|nr:pyridoxal phosphate-dependent aminotransferase [Prevotellaceae bacterium]
MQTIYNFDKVVDRQGTNALKVDALRARYGAEDLIPLWVADMDFEAPPFIVDALRARMEHPVFGYTQISQGYWPSIIRWLEELHGWEVKREWLCYVPGIVTGIGLALNVFSEAGDKVIIQPPVYHPFRLVPEANGRTVACNPLRLANDRYEMDFEQLERLIDDKCKLLILANPHNPGGVVWSRETLLTLSDLCARHRLPVIADEIHADMALYGSRHIPFASVSEAAAQGSITFNAPSKTFNIAGLKSSFAVIPNADLRARFYSWLRANEVNEPAIFASVATEAAYTHGREWLRQMLAYVEGNVGYVEQFLASHIPAIRVMRPQASFLVWLDCRKLGLDHAALVDLFVNRAKLALNDGEMFGSGGEGFMRLNVATPRSVLERAMARLKKGMNLE